MRNEAKIRDIEETGVHIRDCYVWAEIYYLDSPTDFREYLPLHASKQVNRGSDNEIVFLDSCPVRSSPGLYAFLGAVLICFPLVAYLFYKIVEGF
jgi:hypothetical protein